MGQPCYTFQYYQKYCFSHLKFINACPFFFFAIFSQLYYQSCHTLFFSFAVLCFYMFFFLIIEVITYSFLFVFSIFPQLFFFINIKFISLCFFFFCCPPFSNAFLFIINVMTHSFLFFFSRNSSTVLFH